MNQLSVEIAKYISKDIIALWHILMDSKYAEKKHKTIPPTTLAWSRLDREAQVKNNGFEFNLFYNDYIGFIEWKRPPKYGKRPPIGVLVEWARERGIPTDNNTLWAISNNIWFYGWEARPLLEPFGNMLDERMEKKIFDEIFNKITTHLDKYFDK